MIDAIERGSTLTITDYVGAKIIEGLGLNKPLMISKNPRQTLAAFAADWHVTQPKTQVAITGTNGKTSVCHFLMQIWELLGYKAATIGTLGVQGELGILLKHTTPEPVALHNILYNLKQKNVEFVAMEASSHGLDQFRIDGVALEAAAFTNLSRDHLDYHADEDEYLASKCTLFERVLAKGKLVVLNIDDDCAKVVKLVAESQNHKVIQVGYNKDADLRIVDQRFYSDGQAVKVLHMGLSKTVELPLIGDFQATNVLIASALAIALGAQSTQVFNLLPMLKSVPGRMELVGRKRFGGNIYVDYAHSPAALLSALKALKSHVMGKLLLVFGAGGERDVGKRPLMGKVAYENADNIFLTDDNPRKESPEKIRSEVLSGCPSATVIPDRAVAILTAIDALEQGDVLLIAGKGHETGQIIGDDVLPFNDSEFVSMSLSSLERKRI